MICHGKERKTKGKREETAPEELEEKIEEPVEEPPKEPELGASFSEPSDSFDTGGHSAPSELPRWALPGAIAALVIIGGLLLYIHFSYGPLF